MNVHVLNGANLDVLGRRDPALYGGLSIDELETRIYEWGKELDLRVRCRQTNNEGQYIDWCHEALDSAEGVVLNPAAWTHYSYAIRDAVELLTVPVVEVHLSNVDEREEWRRHSVIADLAAKRVIGKGPDGYREALEFLATRRQAVSDRVERVRAASEEPLLVTKPVNVLWLTGLDSSNAAVLVEPDRVRIFTDFRYVEKAKATGLEVVEIPRGLYTRLPELLPKRVAFESEHLPYASWAAIDAGGVETVPTTQLLETVRAVKEPGELDAIRRAAAITNETFARLAEERFTGRTEKELAWWVERTMRDLGAEDVAFPPIVACGPNGALPHASPRDVAIEPGQAVVVDAAAKIDGYNSDCTRTFATGELPDELARSYDVCLEAQLAGLEATRAGQIGRDVDAIAREVIAEAGFGELFAHGLGHGLGMEVHEQPGLRPESEDVLQVGGVVTVEPGIYHPGLGGIRIEDLMIIRARASPRCSRPSRRSSS